MENLHIFPAEKFTNDYIEFINGNFENDEHFFLIRGDVKKYPVIQATNVQYVSNPYALSLPILQKINKANKVFLHGTPIFHFLNLLVQPWAYKKCFWMIWGNDLHRFLVPQKNIKDKIKAFVNERTVSRIDNVITYFDDDAKLARERYSKNFIQHECIAYLSNVFTLEKPPSHEGTEIKILVGNSADPNNNHGDAFDALMPYKDKDIKIYCPLSYGDMEYAARIVQKGNELFGDKFVALTELLPRDEYLNLLYDVDIALFPQGKQRAMGNIINLLGLGKKVYIRDDGAQSEFWTTKGVTYFDCTDFNIEPIDKAVAEKNNALIKAYFSKENLFKQWKRIFEV